MKRFSEQLHTQAQTVKLKKSEQADLRARIVSYMEYHPLPADMKTATVGPIKKASRQEILTESFGQFAIPYQSFFKWGSVAAMFVLVVIPFMAERTVPGDTLYAVKVQFNEELRSTLTWGSYEKVEWETTRLNRRIAEARLLADEGLLTPEAEAEVAAAVKVHSDNAKREIEVLRASDADEATIAEIAFDSSLELQSQTFAEQVDGEPVATGMLISDAIDESREQSALAAPADVPAYGKLMARVELNTTRVRELRDSLQGVVSDQALLDVTRRIEDIDRVVGEAIALAADPETELEARETLIAVLTRTQKLIVFMADLEVQERVEIETAVPMVPTDDEITSDRATRQNKIDATLTKLVAAEQVLKDQDIKAKITDTITKLTKANEALAATAKYTEFKVVSDNAITLGDDALLLLRTQGVDLATLVPTKPQTSISTATSSPAAPVTATSSVATTTTAQADTAL